MTSSDQCFCLPFYPGIWRAAFALPARSRCKHAVGLRPCPRSGSTGGVSGAARSGQAQEFLTYISRSGMKTLPPQTERGAAGGRPPPPARVCSWVGKASWPGPGWRLAEALTPARRHSGPAVERLLLGQGQTPAAGQPDARPGGSLGPAAAGGFIPHFASGTKPGGQLSAGTSRPRRANDRRAQACAGRGARRLNH